MYTLQQPLMQSSSALTSAPEPNARKEAEREGVDIRLYRVIYDLLDDVKAAMSGLLEPEFKEVVLGRAEVRQTFLAFPTWVPLPVATCRKARLPETRSQGPQG